jgi:hypothetical protein
MKTILSITVLLLITLQCFSQASSDQLLYEQKAVKYTKMKKTGTFLTVTGGILTTVGFVILANSSIHTYEDGYGNVETTTEGNPALGAVTLLLGTGGLGAGIPLWVVGSKNQRKYETRAKGLSFKIKAAPKHTGLALTYRF